MKHENTISPDCAVVVSSCDAFSDVWRPFFTLFFRYWPDCPFPVYLISNEKTYSDPRVRPLLVGPDQGWATNTKRALEHLSQPYILWFVEDLFLEKPTDTAVLLKLLDHMRSERAATVRLYPSPMPDEDCSSSLEIGKIGTDAPYRVSLLTGFWDRTIFRGLIREGESIWKMEIDGTERSRSLSSPFFSVKKPAFHFFERTAIIRGRWVYEAVRLCRREGISLDHSRRGIAYGRYWLQWIDRTRKTSWARRIRNIPGIGMLAKQTTQWVRSLLT